MSADPAAGRRRDDLPSVDRLLTLSDGVVAIALTLLVLQLRVPSLPVLHANSASDLATQLGHDGDQFITYAIAFYVIAQFWLVHHRVFRNISGHVEGLAWLNFAFLFTISVMPFTSELLGTYGGNPLAVDIFAFNLLLASLATQATSIYGSRNALLAPDADKATLRAGMTRGTLMSAVIVVSMAVAWVSTDLAKYLWLLMALIPRALARWPGGRAAG